MQDLIQGLKKENTTKIVMLVSDGLGGLPMKPGGKTELEQAETPNLDALAKRGAQGAMYPIARGITPGSGPGHLGLFGYDPVKYLIGRGALEATGVKFPLGPNDVAIRCNFCTLDAEGKISDRRAGRIPTEESTPLVLKLREISIPGVEIFVEPVKEHRFVVVLRAEGLGGKVADTDPQREGVPPLDPKPTEDCEGCRRTCQFAKKFFEEACKLLADEKKANGLTMRGFAKLPHIPRFEDVYGTRAAAIAVYPMYKGLAQLVGMDIVGEPATLSEEIDVLEQCWDDYDFFFVHFKYTDSRGEDGDFDEKVKMVEELDSIIPRIEKLGPDVLIVTCDHSTPAKLSSHSWHSCPTLIVADDVRVDMTEAYSETESECRGGLGHFPAVELMPQALAFAGRLEKFGA